MLKRIRSLDDGLKYADNYQATVARAETTARQLTPAQLRAFEARYQRHPQLPVDAHLAAAVSPVPDEVFDQMAAQYAEQSFGPATGQRMPAAQLRRMERNADGGLSGGAAQGSLPGLGRGSLAERVIRGAAPAPIRSAAGLLGFSGVDSGAQQTVDAVRASRGAIGQAVGFVDDNALGGTLSQAGDVAAAIGRGAVGAASTVNNSPVGAGVRAFTRNAMPVLDAPGQLIQAGARQVYGANLDASQGDYLGALEGLAELGRPQSMALAMQTDFGQLVRYRAEQARGALNAVLGNEYEIRSDLGDGFFINQESELVERRQRAERQMGVLPNGQTVTLGRAVAFGYGFDPEGTAYSIVSGLTDAAVAIGAPGVEVGAARGLQGGGRAVQQALGGLSDQAFVSGLHRSVDIPAARAWIHSEEADGVVRAFAEATGDEGWEQIWRYTNGSLEPTVVTRLNDAQTPEDVRFVLEQAILEGATPSIRNAGGRAISDSTSWLGDNVFRQSGLQRLRGMTPENTLSLVDPQRSVNFVADFSRNVKADAAFRSRYLAAMGRASNEFERYDVAAEMLAETAVRLSDGGIPAERAQALTRMLRDESETTRTSLQEMIEGADVNWSTYMMGPDDTRMPSIHLMSQAAMELPMPDFRELRRATSWARPLWEMSEQPGAAEILVNTLGRGWQNTFDYLMMYQTRWKQARLLRGGYPLRTWMTEEPLRRLVDGRTGFSHPGGVFASMLERDIRSGSDVDDMIRQVRELGEQFQNLSDADALEIAMIRNIRPSRGVRDAVTGGELEAVDGVRIDERLGGLLNEQARDEFTGPWQRYERNGNNPESYRRAWRDELMVTGQDEVAQRIARYGVDETFERLVGQEATLWARVQSLAPETEDPTQLRNYLDLIANKIQALTGGDEALLQVVRSGTWSESIDLAELAARQVGPQAVAGRSALRGEEVGALDRAVNGFFDMIITRPTNELLRVPLFRQEYENMLVQMAPLAKDPAEIVAAARRANVSAENLAVIERSARGEGLLDLERLSALAKTAAARAVQELHFDATRTSNFFDQMRLIAPFGEAWREVVTTWTRLLKADPFTPTRFGGQTAEAVQSTDFGETYFDLAGAEDREDSGFFYENERGEMVFYYPGSRQFTQWYTSKGRVNVGPFAFINPMQDNGTGGVPVDLEGSLSGLNIAGEIFPGLGPVSGLAANEVLPQGTSWDPVREAIFPYGPPDSLLEASQLLPSWMNTMVRGDGGMNADEARVYGNTRLRVMKYLYSTGNYGTGDAEFQRLIADADQITPLTFVARGIAQFTAPSAPQLSFNMVTADGELADLAALTDHYYRLYEEDPNNALERFLAENGDGTYLIAQGGTQSRFPGGTPLEGAGYDWVRDNPSVESDHRELHGFFAPIGEGSEFSQEAYRRSLERGDRVVLSAEDQIRLANHRRAMLEYRPLSEAVPPGQRTPEQQLLLDNLRRQLMRDWPGFMNVDGIGGRDPAYQLIDRGLVDNALADPILLETNAGAALQEYWRFRSEVLATAGANGVNVTGSSGWRTSNEGEPYRAALRAAGEELVAQEPEFARMWDLFLSQEFAREDG